MITKNRVERCNHLLKLNRILNTDLNWNANFKSSPEKPCVWVLLSAPVQPLGHFGFRCVNWKFFVCVRFIYVFCSFEVFSWRIQDNETNHLGKLPLLVEKHQLPRDSASFYKKDTEHGKVSLPIKTKNLLSSAKYQLLYGSKDRFVQQTWGAATRCNTLF